MCYKTATENAIKLEKSHKKNRNKLLRGCISTLKGSDPKRKLLKKLTLWLRVSISTV